MRFFRENPFLFKLSEKGILDQKLFFFQIKKAKIWVANLSGITLPHEYSLKIMLKI